MKNWDTRISKLNVLIWYNMHAKKYCLWEMNHESLLLWIFQLEEWSCVWAEGETNKQTIYTNLLVWLEWRWWWRVGDAEIVQFWGRRAVGIDKSDMIHWYKLHSLRAGRNATTLLGNWRGSGECLMGFILHIHMSSHNIHNRSTPFSSPSLIPTQNAKWNGRWFRYSYHQFKSGNYQNKGTYSKVWREAKLRYNSDAIYCGDNFILPSQIGKLPHKN